MRRKEALYAVIGGVVGAVLAMAAVRSCHSELKVSPAVTSARIICTQLEVVSNGKSIVKIGSSENGGFVVLCNKRGMPEAAMRISESGGLVNVRGRAKRSLSGSAYARL